ncbi:MAG: M48 family metalloprotease [Planctomycetes bacterium]|nr:M48 family metalloprotease [Planctomycetota bacterium]
METFARQQEARRLAGLALGIVGAWIGGLALVWTAILVAVLHRITPATVGYSAWNQTTLLGVFGTLLAAAIAIFGWRSYCLRRGGTCEAERLGAARCDEPVLRDALERLSVTAGMPVPELHVLDAPFCNAWSIGVDPFDATIVLTRGALDGLDVNVVRSLLAREIVHIAEGSTLLNTRVACITAPLNWLSVRARGLERRVATWPAPLRPLGLAIAWSLHVANAPAYAGARIAKAFVHRVRGATADLSGMVLGADADGVALALRRAHDDPDASRARLTATRLLDYDHALFVSIRGTWLEVLRTHPEFEERLRRIGLGKSQVRSDWTFAESTLRPIAMSPDDAIETLGELEAGHVRRGAAIVDAIPSSIRSAVRDPLGCHAVIATVLTRASSKRHDRQRTRFTNEGCTEAVLAARDLHADVKDLDPATWLALADLAAPAMRAMNEAARDRLDHDLALLANGDTETLEFFVASTWRHALRTIRSGPRLLRRPRTLQRDDATSLVAFVLMLARLGGENEQSARTAFGNALALLGVPPGRRRFSDVNQRIVGIVSEGLVRFASTSAATKRRILAGAATALAGDNALEPGEVELLRAIGKSIGCVIPPQKDLRHDGVRDGQAAHDRVLAELWTDEIAEMLQTAAT